MKCPELPVEFRLLNKKNHAYVNLNIYGFPKKHSAVWPAITNRYIWAKRLINKINTTLQREKKEKRLIFLHSWQLEYLRCAPACHTGHKSEGQLVTQITGSNFFSREGYDAYFFILSVCLLNV